MAAGRCLMWSCLVLRMQGFCRRLPRASRPGLRARWGANVRTARLEPGTGHQTTAPCPIRRHALQSPASANPPRATRSRRLAAGEGCGRDPVARARQAERPAPDAAPGPAHPGPDPGPGDGSGAATLHVARPARSGGDHSDLVREPARPRAARVGSTFRREPSLESAAAPVALLVHQSAETPDRPRSAPLRG